MVVLLFSVVKVKLWAMALWAKTTKTEAKERSLFMSVVVAGYWTVVTIAVGLKVFSVVPPVTVAPV